MQVCGIHREKHCALPYGIAHVIIEIDDLPRHSRHDRNLFGRRRLAGIGKPACDGCFADRFRFYSTQGLFLRDFLLAAAGEQNSAECQSPDCLLFHNLIPPIAKICCNSISLS